MGNRKKVTLVVASLLAAWSCNALAAGEKIVSADAGVTALVYAFGMQQQLVGIDVTSVQPVTDKPVARVGYHRQLSAEGVLSLHPDVLVGSDTMGPPDVLTAVEAAGVKVVRLPSAVDANGLLANVQQLAVALGNEPQGKMVLQALENKLQQLAHKKLSAGTSALFLLEAGGRGLRAAGKGTGGDALVHLIGANNVMDHASYQPISAEAILAMDPDVILVAVDDEKNAGANLLQLYPALAALQATKNGRLLSVNSETLVAGLSVLTVDEALRLVSQ